MASAARLRDRPHAAFALDRLDDDRRGVGRDRRRDGGDVGRIDERHARHQRRERRAIVIVPRHRQRAHRPAVERMREGDVLRARRSLRVPEAARELQARLDRFRAAVAEERARQPGELRQRASPAPTAADGGTGSTCGAASTPAPRSRAPGPDARGRARPRRRPRSGRGSARPSRVNSAQPLPRLEDHRRAPVDLQHVLRVEGDRIV